MTASNNDFPQLSASQSNKELRINELMDAISQAATFGRDPDTTTGVTWGLLGGSLMVDGVLTTVAAQTVTLGATATNYVERTRAGVASTNTTGFTAGRVALYTVTTASSVVTAYADHRHMQNSEGIIGRLSLSVAGSSDVTLTAAQARNGLLNFTGALTGNINVIVPVGPQEWTVSNNTSGAYSLTVKTAAGTGVAVTQGAAGLLFADGTNVVGASSAAGGGGSVTSVTLTQPAAGLTLTNSGSSQTTAASSVFALANDLAALEGLSSTGIPNRTGTDTYSQLAFDTSTALGTSNTTVPSQNAVKAYVDAAIAGLSWKQAVRVATTVAGTLASSFENGDTVDGVVLATGNRILVKDQASGAENGIYVVAASGAPGRASDADTGAELVNASVYVSEGTANADTQWTCTTNATITVGSTSLTFAQLTSGGSVATDAIWDAAGDLAVGSGANTAAKLTMGSALQILRVNAAGTALEWAAESGGISVTTIISTVSKTRPADTTTYAVDDAVSESTSAGTVWSFTNMAASNGLGGILQGVDLIISTAQSLKFDGELWLFDTAPASGLNDNAAWTPTDAEMKTKICTLSLNGGSWRTGSGNGSIELAGLAIAYQCAGGATSLYGVLRAKNAYIPTSAEELTLRLHAIQG